MNFTNYILDYKLYIDFTDYILNTETRIFSPHKVIKSSILQNKSYIFNCT